MKTIILEIPIIVVVNEC